jgi:hypothetical protein
MKTKPSAIRCTFSREELKLHYILLGAEIGRIREHGAINDLKPSETSKPVADISMTMDRINRYLQDTEDSEPKQPLLNPQSGAQANS